MVSIALSLNKLFGIREKTWCEEYFLWSVMSMRINRVLARQLRQSKVFREETILKGKIL